MAHRILGAVTLLLTITICSGACGVKGDPLPPLKIDKQPVEQVKAEDAEKKKKKKATQ